MANKSARQPNNREKNHVSFGQMIKLCCYFTIKHGSKVDIRVGEHIF